MDNYDDSVNNAKISDSAYSNSCSNSQSRRSLSSKSTHSGSNSSGSSGYGGNPSTSGYSNNSNKASEKRNTDKEIKKQNKVITALEPSELKREFPWPPAPVFETPKEDNNDVDRTPPDSSVQVEKGTESMDISTPDQSSGKDESSFCNVPITTSANVTNRRHSTDGFSCVVSMQDGVVMYAADSITTALGFPKDMWIGRSFIEFVHPRDHRTFASQITSGLSVPKNDSGTEPKAPDLGNQVCSMVCRIRRYRGFTSGFDVRDKAVKFMPFTLKFYFKNIKDEDRQTIYLVIRATPIFSAFKTPNEEVPEAVPFVMRHSASGSLEYIDPKSIQYLGYLPQDVVNMDVLQLYHPSDLPYLRQVYETIVKEGEVPRSKPYRMLTQNGYYLKLETEWSSFINPWSKKLEFVSCKHYIIEGPPNPDVLLTPEFYIKIKGTEEDRYKTEALRESIVRIMNKVQTKPAEAAKQQMSKRCQDLDSIWESLIQEKPKVEDEHRPNVHDADDSCTRESVVLGSLRVSPYHDRNESVTSTETQISYNQLNYNETLQRYFDCHENLEGSKLLMINTKQEVQNTDASSSNYMSSLDISLDFASDSSVVVIPSPSQIARDGYRQVRLTESLLNRHNAEMEEKLVKTHRQNKSNKRKRDKSSSEIRQKIKEHLARCNVLYTSTDATASTVESQPHGIKRPSKQSEEEVSHKHQCRSSQFQARPTCIVSARTNTSNTANVAPCPGSHMNSMNGVILGVDIPQPMHAPEVYPMYYTPIIHEPRCSTVTSNSTATHAHLQGFTHPVDALCNVNLACNSASGGPNQPTHQMPCMVFEQAVCGSPIFSHQLTNTYSSINPQIYAMHPTCAFSHMENARPLKLGQYEDISDCSSSRSRNKSKSHRGKTDEESSHSSFYSSYLKTDSGSTVESDLKNKDEGMTLRADNGPTTKNMGAAYKNESHPTKMTKMEQDRLTAQLMNKYKILTKNLEEVLAQDREILKKLEQPSLVNEQLSQLYLDLQLEGVAEKLNLEEGITSSSSSGEETTSTSPKTRKRKRQYNKLVMVYEENAPLPPSDDAASSSSTL